jgi:hypothetical protein
MLLTDGVCSRRWWGPKAVAWTLVLAALLSGCEAQPRTSGPEGTPTPPSRELPAPLPPPPPPPCPGAIQWHEAHAHVGEFRRVIGSVVSTRFASTSRGSPTFLNLGKPYPDSGRFQVVIWAENRANFPGAPESFYLGRTICVTGLIEVFRGIPEIEADSSEDISIV